MTVHSNPPLLSHPHKRPMKSQFRLTLTLTTSPSSWSAWWRHACRILMPTKSGAQFVLDRVAATVHVIHHSPHDSLIGCSREGKTSLNSRWGERKAKVYRKAPRTQRRIRIDGRLLCVAYFWSGMGLVIFYDHPSTFLAHLQIATISYSSLLSTAALHINPPFLTT